MRLVLWFIYAHCTQISPNFSFCTLLEEKPQTQRQSRQEAESRRDGWRETFRFKEARKTEKKGKLNLAILLR